MQEDVRTKHDLRPLILDEHQSLYWIGFLLADGYFDLNRKAIKLCLGPKDKDHQNSFASFIRATARDEVSVQNRYYVPLIAKKYDIKHRKTYHPPDLNTYDVSDDLLVSLLIGIFDGDGCITLNTKGYLGGRLTSHSAWLPFYSSLRDRIGIINRPYINNSGYMYASINRNQLVSLKKHSLTNGIYTLNRKWDKVLVS